MKNKTRRIAGIVSCAIIAGSILAPAGSPISNIIPSMAITASAATASTYGNFSYTTNSTGITITKYNGTASIVTIPDKINNKKVTEICASAFINNTKVKKVTIGQYVTAIGNHAFKGCTNLEEVIYKGDVSTTKLAIASYAFDGCKKLNKADSRLFECATSVSTSAFRNCALSNVNVNLSNVKTIGNSAFLGTGINKLIVGASLESIGNSAFKGCTNLARIDGTEPFGTAGHTTIPNIENASYTVGADAFNGCSKLTDITQHFTSHITNIGDRAFYNCSKLKDTNGDIRLNYATYIGNDAFSGCSSIEAINFSYRLQSIGDNAFKNCSSLEHVLYFGDIRCENTNYFGHSSTTFTVGKNAFRNCSNISKVYGDFFKQMTSIGDYAFADCKNLELINYEEKKEIELYFEKTKTIGSFAFKNCLEIDRIRLGKNITSIGNGAFYGTNVNTVIWEKMRVLVGMGYEAFPSDSTHYDEF